MTSVHINGKKTYLSETVIFNVNKSLHHNGVRIENGMHLFCDNNLVPNIFYKINDKIPLSKEELSQLKYIVHTEGTHKRITSDGITYILDDNTLNLLKNPLDRIIDTNSKSFEQMLNHINNPYHKLDKSIWYDFKRILNYKINFDSPRSISDTKISSTKTDTNNDKLNLLTTGNSDAEFNYYNETSHFDPTLTIESYLSKYPQVTFHKSLYKRHTNVNILKYYPKPIKSHNIIKWVISNENIKTNNLASINNLVLLHNKIDNFTKNIKNIKIFFSDNEFVFEIMELSGSGLFVLNNLLKHDTTETKTPIPLLRKQNCLYYALHDNNNYDFNIEITTYDKCDKYDMSLFTTLSGLASQEELYKFKTNSHEELVTSVKEYEFKHSIKEITSATQGIICVFIPDGTNSPQYSITNFDNSLWAMSVVQDGKVIDTINKKYNYDPYNLPNAPIYVSSYCFNMFAHQPNGHKIFKNASFISKSKVPGITKVLVIQNKVYRFMDSILASVCDDNDNDNGNDNNSMWK